MSPRISIHLLAGQSDQRLVALVREGHERAFEALVHRYRRPLLRYCRRLRLSDARAEDVLQQAFLQAWLALARGVEVRELKPWLYRIVHNAAVNAMRAPLDSHVPLSEAPLASAAVAGESELERRIALRDALAGVAALPRLQQQAIFLTAVDGQSHDEAASALGLSHGALRGLLYRARSTLRSAAAALTPPPLLAWAAGRGGGAGASASTGRLAELATGAGGAGLAGVALKGAAVAVTAAVLAGGAAVVSQRRDAPATHAGDALSAPARGAPAGASAVASASPLPVAAASTRPRHATPGARRRDAGDDRSVRTRRDGRDGRSQDGREGREGGDGPAGRDGADTPETPTNADEGAQPQRSTRGEPSAALSSDGSNPTSGSSGGGSAGSGSGDRSGSGGGGSGGEDGAGGSGTPSPSTDGPAPEGASVATATSDGISGDGRAASGAEDGDAVAEHAS